MSARFLIACLSSAVLFLAADRAQLTAAEDKDKLVPRVYAVADLVIPLDKAPQDSKESPPAAGAPANDSPQVATVSSGCRRRPSKIGS